MKYYKIILNSQIVGVCNSNDCWRFQEKNGILQSASDEKMEYLQYNYVLYHAGWMNPIITNKYNYINATIITIEEQEYNTLAPAIEQAPIYIDNTEQSAPPVEPENPIEEITVEFMREAKINEMSSTCHNIIENGFDLELRGEIHHFSLTTQDQLNLISLSSMAQTQSLIPYHADGEECIFYTSEEIGEIVATATSFKIYHTTYYNALKGYINALDSVEAIGAITYGTEIPEEYKSDVLKALEQ